MKTYIGLLRGINVGGKNKLLMKELKLALEKIGLNQLTTYIQSGNIVFRASSNSSNRLATSITATIKSAFKLEVPCIVLTLNELIHIEQNNPYYLRDVDISKKYGAFLSKIPTEESKQKLATFNIGGDQYIIEGTFVYLCYSAMVGTSKLSNGLIEKKLGVMATSRNWKTIRKLIEIGKEMSA